jgi:ATP-dependent RNA helicase RhlE
MNFKDLGLSEALLKAIDKKGYTQPSPIQEKAIPEVLK